MTQTEIKDWDDAYANGAYVPGATEYPDKWARGADEFRAGWPDKSLDLAYGTSDRQKLDFFFPKGASRGLLVFVHGGYWLRFDKNFWSQFAAGSLSRGWTVCLPSYDLAPAVGIGDITKQIGSAVIFAGQSCDGPVRLAGHSAGGHLVARASTATSGARWQERLVQTVAVSPVAYLAPLIRTSMNADLKLDDAEVLTESPVHLPTPKTPVTVWVGAKERPVFLEQAAALAEAWKCDQVIAPEKHHFDVIEELSSVESALTREVMG